MATRGTAAIDSKSKQPTCLFVRDVWRNIERIHEEVAEHAGEETSACGCDTTGRCSIGRSLRDPVVMVAVFTLTSRFSGRRAPEDFALMRPELALADAEEKRPDPPDPFTVPCYFNTGCCAFADCDVRTAIEIRNGKVEAGGAGSTTKGRPQPQVLTDEEDIGQVFDRVRAKDGRR